MIADTEPLLCTTIEVSGSEGPRQHLRGTSVAFSPASMAERDVDRTPSKTRDAGTIDQADVLQTDYNTTHSSMASAHVDDDAHGPDVAIQSAYTAPPYPRPQAERDDMAGLGELSASHDNRKRGDLTAHNLEMIPDADQVAPGIRLGREGNEGYDQAAQDATRYREAQIAPREASHVHEHDHLMDQHGGDHEEVGSDVGGDGGADSHDQHRSVRHMPGEDVESIKAPSSVGAQGSSSTGHGAGLDVDDDDDDDDGLHEAGGEQQRAGIVHERVGGSGATSENASKGASVGHFGPRGEAIRKYTSKAINRLCGCSFDRCCQANRVQPWQLECHHTSIHGNLISGRQVPEPLLSFRWPFIHLHLQKHWDPVAWVQAHLLCHQRGRHSWIRVTRQSPLTMAP